MGLSISENGYSSPWICVSRIHRGTFFLLFRPGGMPVRVHCQCVSEKKNLGLPWLLGEVSLAWPWLEGVRI